MRRGRGRGRGRDEAEEEAEAEAEAEEEEEEEEEGEEEEEEEEEKEEEEEQEEEEEEEDSFGETQKNAKVRSVKARKAGAGNESQGAPSSPVNEQERTPQGWRGAEERLSQGAAVGNGHGWARTLCMTLPRLSLP